MQSDVVHEANTSGEDLVAVGTLELLTRGLVAHRPALRHHHLCGPCAGLTLDPGVKMQKSSFNGILLLLASYEFYDLVLVLSGNPSFELPITLIVS